MTTTLTTTAPRASALASPLSAKQKQRVKFYVEQEKAPATLRAYRTAWNQFAAWAKREGHSALPATPEVVAAYFTDLADAGAKVSTIMVTLVALA